MEHYLFLVKKFLGNLFMPVPVLVLLLFWAFMLLLRKKTRWFGTIVVLLIAVMFFAASYSPITNHYINQLEAQIPVYQHNDQKPVDHIAVLGAWHQSVADQPLTSQVGTSGIVRLTEGIRIYRLNPDSKLIFTGFKGTDEDAVSYPVKLKELAVALGVTEQDILTFDGPRDTVEEAQLIADKFPQTNLVLVTSAPHMPRALGLFHGAGLDPIPAPTEHQGKPVKSWWVFPNARTLAKSEYWAHEGLGYLWARLMGQFKDQSATTQSQQE